MKPPAKRHWHPEARKFFREITSKFHLEHHELQIFYGCIENLDRFYKAKATLEQDGMTYLSEKGIPKKHPLLEVERQSWASFLSGMKHLPFTDALSKSKKEPLKKGAGRPLRRF